MAGRRETEAGWQRLTRDVPAWQSEHDASGMASPVPGPPVDERIQRVVRHLIATDPSGAHGAWRRLDALIVEGGHATWGVQVLGRLLNDPSALGSPTLDPGTWGAFLTTYAECVRRCHGVAAAGGLWPRAWDGLKALPPSSERSALMIRAASGGLVHGMSVRTADPPLDRWIQRVQAVLAEPQPGGRTPAQLAPVIAALMACADALDLARDPTARAPDQLERLAARSSEVPRLPERALALVCEGRLARRRQDVDVARRRLQAALDTVAEAVAASPAGIQTEPSLHWPPTLDVVSWVALDAVRALHGLEPVEQTRARLDALPPLASTVSASRARAFARLLDADIQVPRPEGLAQALGDVSPLDLARPDCAAHVLVLPEGAVRALGAIARGRPASGLAALDTLTTALTTAHVMEVARAVDRARLEALAWLHLRELAPPAAGDIKTAGTRADRHSIWRLQQALDDEARRALGTWGRRYLSTPVEDGEGEYASASVALDLVECAELGAEATLVAPGPTLVPPEDWWRRHAALPDLALRLWIRGAALGVSQGGPTTALVRAVGVRRAARIAQDEGEHLVMRLPGQAAYLFALALTWYEDADDPVGTWQATVSLGLARVRAGAVREDIDLAAVQRAHDGLVARAALPGGPDALPPWAELERPPVADPPGDTSRDDRPGSRRTPAEWQPWLLRLAELRRWAETGPGSIPSLRSQPDGSTSSRRPTWWAGWLSRRD